MKQREWQRVFGAIFGQGERILREPVLEDIRRSSETALRNVRRSRQVRTIDIREARNNLTRLVDEAAGDDPFVIAVSGRPMVKVVALEQARERPTRLGFLAEKFSVPDDFDSMGECQVRALFAGKD